MNNQTAYVTVQLSKELRKLLKNQTKRTRTAYTAAICAYIIAIKTAVKCRKQEEAIYQLNVRLKKLERSEGE